MESAATSPLASSAGSPSVRAAPALLGGDGRGQLGGEIGRGEVHCLQHGVHESADFSAPWKAGERGDNGSQSCLRAGFGVRLRRLGPGSGGAHSRLGDGLGRADSGRRARSGGGVIGFVTDPRCLRLAAHDFARSPAVIPL